MYVMHENMFNKLLYYTLNLNDIGNNNNVELYIRDYKIIFLPDTFLLLLKNICWYILICYA